MKYILLIPIAGYYLIRDMHTLIMHDELIRGLSLFILLFLFLLFFSAWLNIARELTRVKKQIGSGTYDWLVTK
ncbi:MAG TPA: hypothetical protein DCX45_03505 [Acinetobacter junii]|nr:hypothetical protein [Acinetobacter junii]